MGTVHMPAGLDWARLTSRRHRPCHLHTRGRARAANDDFNIESTTPRHMRWHAARRWKRQRDPEIPITKLLHMFDDTAHSAASYRGHARRSCVHRPGVWPTAVYLSIIIYWSIDILNSRNIITYNFTVRRLYGVYCTPRDTRPLRNPGVLGHVTSHEQPDRFGRFTPPAHTV